MRPSRGVGCIACIATVCVGGVDRGNTVAPTTPPAIRNAAAAAATAVDEQVRRDRCCRLAAAWASEAHVVDRTVGRRAARDVGQRQRFLTAQRVEDARQSRRIR